MLPVNLKLRCPEPGTLKIVASRSGFTLIELLLVVSIIALLAGVLLPAMSLARKRAIGVVCLAQLHTLGQGLGMYTMQNRDRLPPSRMPDLGDGINWRVHIKGGLKYRPTFLAILGSDVGLPAFREPMSTKIAVDSAGERGDMQNYASRTFVCPAVPHWTDERNGSYGYNYQFLGNKRLRNPQDRWSFKNWPVPASRIKAPGRCVAVADSMGTAASFSQRREYQDDARDADRLGNEGFNLDPPRVDPVRGEMANRDSTPQSRTALHARHGRRGAVLWLDAHSDMATPEQLGYRTGEDGIVHVDGRNALFHDRGLDVAWRQ
jgi:prepilin-type N-terminal cleavage/methylation domain-containing protein